MDRWDSRVPRRVGHQKVGPKMGGGKLFWDDDGPTREESRECGSDEAVDMKERHHQVRRVVRIETVRRLNVEESRENVFVSERYELGSSSSS